MKIGLLCVVFVLCGVVLGCRTQAEISNGHIKYAERTCPLQAARSCQGFRSKRASFTKADCRREVRLWCVLEQKCKFLCETSHFRLGGSGSCFGRCVKKEKRTIRKRFQEALPTCTKSSPPTCVRELKGKLFGVYEQEVFKMRFQPKAQSKPPASR